MHGRVRFNSRGIDALPVFIFAVGATTFPFTPKHQRSRFFCVISTGKRTTMGYEGWFQSKRFNVLKILFLLFITTTVIMLPKDHRMRCPISVPKVSGTGKAWRLELLCLRLPLQQLKNKTHSHARAFRDLSRHSGRRKSHNKVIFQPLIDNPFPSQIVL